MEVGLVLSHHLDVEAVLVPKSDLSLTIVCPHLRTDTLINNPILITQTFPILVELRVAHQHQPLLWLLPKQQQQNVMVNGLLLWVQRE
jgi:hypothetical protein